MLIRSTNKVHGDPSSRQILKRDARTTCNTQAYLDARGEPFDVTKRNNNPDYDECNHTIGKELSPRTMTLPKNDIQPFNTALFQEIGGDQAKSLGTDGLCGCTVLVIASRTGVYMAHYFKDFSFTEDEYWDEKMKMGLEQRFTNLVIGGLTNGLNPNPRARRPQQVSLTSCAAKILEGAGPDPNDNKIKDISYDPLNNNDDALWDTAAGKVLFKYDPDHNKQKKAALWTEGDPTDRHNDQWTL
ncbi:uncharacterized protein PAC_15873 [Phialocephala subalpina]|uniref:Uncharacterized protein n=1 Tax=Phialocephala subalpina TaxID=576137 RepID=A0A1L7XLT1_9HELO|nr:uncharacterized protein PAC_15873 [Phialocephala subalpina]